MTVLDMLCDAGKALIPVAVGVNWVLWRGNWRSNERLTERERKLDDKIARALVVGEISREAKVDSPPSLFPRQVYELMCCMLAHAAHGELDDLSTLIYLQSTEIRHLVLDQCMSIADCIVSGRTSVWPPNEEELRLIAAVAMSSIEKSRNETACTTPLDGVSGELVYSYLFRVVICGEDVEDVFANRN